MCSRKAPMASQAVQNFQALSIGDTQLFNVNQIVVNKNELKNILGQVVPAFCITIF